MSKMKYLKRLSIFTLWLATIPGAAYADPQPPQIIFSNGVKLISNEIVVGYFQKKYSMINLFDKNPLTAWVYEAKTGRPILTLYIPAEYQVDKINLINGYAKSDTLYHNNNRISNIVVHGREGGAEEDYALNTEDLGIQNLNLTPPLSGKIDFVIDRVIKGKKYNDTCISEFDIYSGNKSLFNVPAYVASSGGEYPSHDIYIGGKKFKTFDPQTIYDIFFIENGKYAIFVHEEEMWMSGLTIVNVETRKEKMDLLDVNIKHGTLRWDNGRFSGIELKKGKEIPFSRVVRLP